MMNHFNYIGKLKIIKKFTLYYKNLNSYWRGGKNIKIWYDGLYKIIPYFWQQVNVCVRTLAGIAYYNFIITI